VGEGQGEEVGEELGEEVGEEEVRAGLRARRRAWDRYLARLLWVLRIQPWLLGLPADQCSLPAAVANGHDTIKKVITDTAVRSN